MIWFGLLCVMLWVRVDLTDLVVWYMIWWLSPCVVLVRFLLWDYCWLASTFVTFFLEIMLLLNKQDQDLNVHRPKFAAGFFLIECFAILIFVGINVLCMSWNVLDLSHFCGSIKWKFLWRRSENAVFCTKDK